VKQLLQYLDDGKTELADAPVPICGRGQLLIRTNRSLISAGTERMLLEFGRAGLLDKARQQPDKVRQVLDKVRTDGLLPTLEAVRSKLDQPVAPGYSNVGVVVEVGSGVSGFQPEDRVVSNGRHAEFVVVPKNLCARVPEAVTNEQAAFTVLGAIALQGIRLAAPTLGETVAVSGLGIVGLLAVQILRANGCRVIGLDPSPARVSLARQLGAAGVDLSNDDDPVRTAVEFSRGQGVDAVLITASTNSNAPVRQAAQMSRKRGRLVLVGVTGLELSRADFYQKELSFQVSCSYGPGRYDSTYEEGGQDYPFGLVRWTEQRNFEAVLDLLSTGAVAVEPLISHRLPFGEARRAYEILSSGEPSLAILLSYPADPPRALQRVVTLHGAAGSANPSVAFIGAGNYAGRVLMPAFKSANADLNVVVTQGSSNGVHYGRKYGFRKVSTDLLETLADRSVDTVVVATRHDSHARLVVQALEAGKHVFVEKPLCLTLPELADITAATAAAPTQALMVGFNRRFSPLVVRMQSLLATVPGPKHIIATVNAGVVPPDHWTMDKARGGGRIVGEACHFIDLLRHLAGWPIRHHRAVAARGSSEQATLTVEFEDGSVGVIHYLTNGHRGFPKERIEVFVAGRVLQLDNFRRLEGWGWPGFSKMSLWQQDKGQRACVAAFVESRRQGAAPIVAVAELLETSRAAIELQENLA
jgi:predicted dehydrogenase/threonine dehydrogenase-like Zn-dependent dehydrogenase